MNKVEIRDALAGHFDVLMNQWKVEGRDLPVQDDNVEEIDLNLVGDEFLVFYIDWNATVQKNIAENPDHRYYGDVVIMLFGKKGTGTRKRTLLEDEISEHFKFKSLGGVTVGVPTPGTGTGRSEKHDGWHAITVKFPFFADSNT